MLLEFNVANFRSIADNVTFSLVSSSFSSSSKIGSAETGLLKVKKAYTVSALFGANGAGKSNIIRALQTMRRFVLTSAKERTLGDEIDYEPFAFDSNYKNKPTILEISFTYGQDKNLYRFGYAFNNQRVLEEWLYYTSNEPKVRQREVYTRVWDNTKNEYVYNTPNLKGDKNKWQNATRENSLFVSSAIQSGADSSFLKDVHFFMAKGLFVKINLNRFQEDFTVKKAKEFEYKSKIISFLNSLDIPMNDFVSREFALEESLPSDMPRELKDFILKTSDNKIDKTFSLYHMKNGEVTTLALEDESTGTQFLFGLVGPLIDALETGLTFVIDEANATIHPSALRFIMEIFSQKETNPHNAQLIIAGHDVSVMDILNKEQIWLTERDRSYRTQLFSLGDISLRDLKNFKKLYLAGRFGAVPSLNYIKAKEIIS